MSISDLEIGRDERYNALLLQCPSCEAQCTLRVNETLRFGYDDEGTATFNRCAQPDLQ